MGFGIMGKRAMETMGQAAATTQKIRPVKEKSAGGGLMAAASGAMAGSMLGPWGAVAGAGVGLASYYLSE